MKKISRREFLHLIAAGIGTAVLSSCKKGKADLPDTPTAPPTIPLNVTPTKMSDQSTAMGIARGILPGRVVWTYNPKAAKWDGRSGFWWLDQNTDQVVVNDMLSQAIRQLTQASDDRRAWSLLFRYFNHTHGGGEMEYQSGEKIAIKVNLNGCDRRVMGSNNSFTSPHALLALLKQLTSNAGVSAQDITVYDALRYVPDCMYEYCQENGMAGVHFADWPGGNGRETCRRDLASQIHWSVDVHGNPTYLPTCVTQAKYLINFASLKGHNLAGVTLCAKNHFGTIQADWKGEASPNAPQGANLHATVAANDFNMGVEWTWSQRPMKTYNALVDLMAHPHLGEKTVLFLLDGLYAAQHQSIEISNASHWQSAPFNQGWSSSIFLSQDGVAIDSVALDFLRNEPTILNTPNVMPANSTCENYLHEASQADHSPSGTVYRSQAKRQAIASLGVHEHWNNAKERKYSRNLGSGNGIELVAVT
jgi:hypothetical protein